MTRTDVMASSRPRSAGAASTRRGPSSVLGELSLASFVVMLALALAPGAALAAEPTSGYTTTTPPTTGTTPTTPATTTTTKTTPSTGTLPSKEAEKPTTSTPSTEPSPEKTSSTPTTTTAKSGTLPFTGFDLRWDIGLGLLLIAAGFSIVVMQRRQRRDGGS
jgi:cytoskeletal protein RodZ